MNPLSKLILIISVLIILFVGVIPSLIVSDWQWFGRSGAILTAFGIFITFKDIVKTLSELSESISDKIDEELKNHDFSNAPKERVAQIENFKSLVMNDITLGSKRSEFWVLFTGTIIWGYGDLFNAFIEPSVTCVC